MFRNTVFRRILILMFWFVMWQILAMVVDNPILMVTPQVVMGRFWELLGQVVFWQTLGSSLLRISVGFVSGLLTAALLAGISSRYSVAEQVLQPFMNLLKTIPVASFVVLLLIWWGSSMLAVAISFLVVLPNIYINALEGIKAADQRLLEMAKVFHMPVKNRFLYIYRPAFRPFLESGMKISLGMCWKSGVAAEVIGMPEYSIGGQIYLSKIYIDTAGVLAWTAAVVLLSLCFEKLALWLTNIFFEWNPSVGRNGKGRKYITAESCLDTNRHGNPRPVILKHVDKAYGETRVLRDISVTYEKGGTYYLTSPSGSGKTTLLRLLCGLERPDGGRIQGEKSSSMVFQEDRLCEDYTALQNVMMVTGEYACAVQALERLLDGEALKKPCRQLSGGMKRRVALVRAMEAASEMVLLDEPFTGMDAHTRQQAEAYIKERQNGRTVIIATHI